jgi:uncharacterized membrane protein
MSKTLARFIVGAIIGFCGAALFSGNPMAALIAAVLCGVAVDKLLRED